MATVSSSLKLFDAMSGPLKNITSSMNMMISTMQRMQSATNRNTNIDKQLNAAKKQLASAEADIRSEIEKATRAQEKFNKASEKSSNGAKKLLSAVKGATIAYLALEAAKKGFEATVIPGAKQQSILDALSARTGNVAHGQAIFDEVTKQALKYRQDVNAALAGSQSFMSSTMDPKKITELNMLAMRLSKLNPTEGLEGAVFSLKELMSGDYTSIAERFNISRTALKDSEARAAGLKGDVEGFIKGMDKLLNQQNMTQEAFEKMLDSPAAKWSGIVETFKFKIASAGRKALKAFNPLLNTLNKIVNSKAFSSFAKGVEKTLTVIGKIITGLIKGVEWLVGVVKSNWPIIEGILAGIVTYFTIMAIQQIPVLIARFGTMVASLWAMIPPILAQAAAWLLVNWWVLLIVAAVAGLVYWLSRIGFGIEEAMGTFEVLKIYFENMIIVMKNGWSSLSDFLHNILIDPVYAVKKLFYDMVLRVLDNFYEMSKGAEEFAGGFVKVLGESINTVLKGVQKLIDALSAIPGFENLKGYTVDLIDTSKPHAVSDALGKARDNFKQNFLPTSDKDVVNTPQLPIKTAEDYVNAWNTGVANGKKLTDKFKKAADEMTGFGGGSQSPNIDKVGEVGKINDKVDISSEDLKTMRELAEMKSIQNFVTLTPTVNMTTGPVNQGADIEVILQQIENALEESISSHASSVYG